MEPESSSPYSQVPAICPYPEPTPSSLHPLPLPEDPPIYVYEFQVGYITYAFLFCHVCYTCHNPFTLPDLSTPVTFAEQRRSWSSPLHKFSPTACCFLALISEYCQHLLSGRSCFPGAFTKFRKATIRLASFYLFACLSVGQHGTTRLPPDGFSWNLIFQYFSILCPENLSVIEIWQE